MNDANRSLDDADHDDGLEFDFDLADAGATADAIRPEDAAILAEIEAQSNKKPSWINAIVVLIVSAILFTGVGAARWNWKFTVLLIPILLFHELGHYVAMVAFNYRNMRMFFIPFFGAAVTGQNYNVAGWKKAIVSLAGPVPGIVVGVILGIFGVLVKQAIAADGAGLLLEAAVLMLVLNGLNLLPVLPFDGGWVVHSVLFVRHHMLDMAFRVAAALALLGVSIASGDRILIYLGIFLLIGIPGAYHTSKMAATLRQYGLPADAPGGKTIPTETALAIIDELRKAHPRGMSNKLAAQLALQVFEQMNARPPGVLASLGLGTVYVMSLLVAIVAFSVFIVVGNSQPPH